jgi:hypothetical protein
MLFRSADVDLGFVFVVDDDNKDDDDEDDDLDDVAVVEPDVMPMPVMRR